MKLIRRNTKIIFILVLPVYLFIVQNSLLNQHTHFYANGMVVTHAHPVNSETGESTGQHPHSKNEICFFSNLHFDYYTVAPEIQFIGINYFESDKHFIRNENVVHLTHPLQNTLRGPPLFRIS